MGIKEIFKEIVKSIEITIGEDGFDRNGNPKKEKIRRPFARPRDGIKLVDDVVNIVNGGRKNKKRGK